MIKEGVKNKTKISYEENINHTRIIQESYKNHTRIEQERIAKEVVNAGEEGTFDDLSWF